MAWQFAITVGLTDRLSKQVDEVLKLWALDTGALREVTARLAAKRIELAKKIRDSQPGADG